MEKLPISVSMISGPEADRIGRALQSVAEWTREIIVLLNHDAHDGTEEVARGFGACGHMMGSLFVVSKIMGVTCSREELWRGPNSVLSNVVWSEGVGGLS